MPTFSNANDKTAITAISVKILFFLMKSIMNINNFIDVKDKEYKYNHIDIEKLGPISSFLIPFFLKHQIIMKKYKFINEK